MKRLFKFQRSLFIGSLGNVQEAQQVQARFEQSWQYADITLAALQ
jgi:hypothetical protein